MACLGFLEAAEILLGGAEGGFDWSDEPEVRFSLRAMGDQNPFAVVLGYLADAEIRSYAPDTSDTFPSPTTERMAHPIRLYGSVNEKQQCIDLDHWADGSSRNAFRLYSGNRSAADIARAMLLV